MGDDVELERLQRRFQRERAARREAEAIAERVTSELYNNMQQLERLNRDLEDANTELETANQAIRDFVSVASHDLRSPLTSIIGFVDMLRAGGESIDPARRTEFLDIVSNQAARLNRLIGDLLTVSKLEAGAVEARVQDIVVARTIEEAVRALGDNASAIKVDGVPDVHVLADPDHLARILQNYLTNALKYGAPPIAASVSVQNGWGEIRVRDNGDGVPDEFIPRLFERFARAETAARSHDGTGLGLSIVRGLARANGGDAWYEPVMPHGSCFAVKLPKAS